jgi:hypothetical protein
MTRWIVALAACGIASLVVPGALCAGDRDSLGGAQLGGTITAVEKVEVNIERSPVIGYVTVGATKVAVTAYTSITVGPGDLVKRSFATLQPGREVEVVFTDPSAPGKGAKQINVLPTPAPGK